MPDDGWGMLILVSIIAAVCGGAMIRDKLRGRYPRDWKD